MPSCAYLPTQPRGVMVVWSKTFVEMVLLCELEGPSPQGGGGLYTTGVYICPLLHEAMTHHSQPKPEPRSKFRQRSTNPFQKAFDPQISFDLYRTRKALKTLHAVHCIPARISRSLRAAVTRSGIACSAKPSFVGREVKNIAIRYPDLQATCKILKGLTSPTAPPPPTATVDRCAISCNSIRVMNSRIHCGIASF